MAYKLSVMRASSQKGTQRLQNTAILLLEQDQLDVFWPIVCLKKGKIFYSDPNLNIPFSKIKVDNFQQPFSLITVQTKSLSLRLVLKIPSLGQHSCNGKSTCLQLWCTICVMTSTTGTTILNLKSIAIIVRCIGQEVEFGVGQVPWMPWFTLGL